jgi:hypothetical protein
MGKAEYRGLPNQSSIVTRIQGSNQLIMVWEGMGHTVIRIQKPRKYEVLLPFYGSFLKTIIPHSTLLYMNSW